MRVVKLLAGSSVTRRVRGAAGVALLGFLLAGCEPLAPPPGMGDAGSGGKGGTTSTSSTITAECLIAVDCPGEDTDCVVRTCELGACGTTMLPLGTPTKNQVSGDCQRAVCDGEGQEVLVVDAADVPFDADPCTDDVCTASIPSNPPSGAGAPCDTDGGKVCDGLGTCVACVGAVDCPAGLACVGNVCM